MNFDYPKNSIFRCDLSVPIPIKEIVIKLPFKIQSQNVTHGDHDFFVWSSLILHPSDLTKLQQVIDTGLTLTLLRDEPLSE